MLEWIGVGGDADAVEAKGADFGVERLAEVVVPGVAEGDLPAPIQVEQTVIAWRERRSVDG